MLPIFRDYRSFIKYAVNQKFPSMDFDLTKTKQPDSETIAIAHTPIIKPTPNYHTLRLPINKPKYTILLSL